MTDLMGDVGTGFTNISVHLPHDSDVFVAIQQRILFISHPVAASGGFVGLQTGVRQDHDHPLRVLVRGGDRYMLLRDELWK